MNLSSIRIENFRCIKDQTVFLDNYNCFVGPNGSGKSTVLNALNIFFRETKNSNNLVNLTEEDFHYKDISKPIRITLTFTDLNTEAQDDFKAYYRQEKLIIFAEAKWNADDLSASVHHYGYRNVMKKFAPFFEALEVGVLVKELKEIYNGLKGEFELPAPGTKDAMTQALREFEESHPELCELLPSEDLFYGWSKGTNKLEKYLQWVYIPAVKDPSTEQEESKNSALGQLLSRTIRTKVDFKPRIKDLKDELKTKYEELITNEQNLLDGLSLQLEKRFREWAHPAVQLKLKWSYNSDKSISIQEPSARIDAGEDNFIGDISRLGHGLQRAFLISLLQELSQSQSEDVPTPKLILGFEEPELYQHPPQSVHLRNTLEELASQESQIIITTHSPYFVSSKGFEQLRITRKDKNGNESIFHHTKLKEVSDMLSQALSEKPVFPSVMQAKIDQIMQPSLNELYFCKYAVLVEGLEDVAYISSHLVLTEQFGKFRKLGCHFVVCDGKTNISRPLAIAKCLGIPVYPIFDSDGDKSGKDEIKKNTRDNSCIIKLVCNDNFDLLSKENVINDNFTMLGGNLGGQIKAEYGDKIWNDSTESVKKEMDWNEGLNQKNSRLISAALEKIYKEIKPSTILESIVERIFKNAE